MDRGAERTALARDCRGRNHVGFDFWDTTPSLNDDDRHFGRGDCCSRQRTCHDGVPTAPEGVHVSVARALGSRGAASSEWNNGGVQLMSRSGLGLGVAVIVSIAALAATALPACGSSGGNSSTPSPDSGGGNDATTVGDDGGSQVFGLEGGSPADGGGGSDGSGSAACGSCAPGQLCSNGACICPAYQVLCNGACTPRARIRTTAAGAARSARRPRCARPAHVRRAASPG